MKKMHFITLVVVLSSLFGCDKTAANPEDTVKLFLEAASYSNIDIMKKLCTGNMCDEIERDEEAIKKVVFQERQSFGNQKNKDSELKKIAKLKNSQANFNFTYIILNEETFIEPKSHAKVSALLSRKGQSVTRVYELTWVKSGWLITQARNEERQQ